MKKMGLIFFFLLLIPAVEAENLLDINWNFGSIGLGMNHSSDSDDSVELTMAFFNFIIDYSVINLGIEFNPIKYWHLFKWQNQPELHDNGQKLSLLNTSVYWDLIRHKDFLLGPFASINYVYVLTGIDMSEAVFGCGLRFSYRLSDTTFFNNYNQQIISSEIGYRNFMGVNKFYFAISADLLLGLHYAGTGLGKLQSQNTRPDLDIWEP
ncbi:MAG: hypothetical protein LBD48_04870 [Treponema sp.]|jgi:hypothetical protein|nr:hypothetical protein [Treponema sp.]